MSDNSAILRPDDLSQNGPTTFDLRPDASQIQAIAGQLGLLGLRKLRFAGAITPHGKSDWNLTARLGATIVQACVVTLEPVTTRIDTDVKRHFLSTWTDPKEDDVEMPGDDTSEPLGLTIDLNRILVEALALALPDYPRKDGADLGEAVFTAPGKTPLRDQDSKPFAGLQSLRDQMKNGG